MWSIDNDWRCCWQTDAELSCHLSSCQNAGNKHARSRDFCGCFRKKLQEDEGGQYEEWEMAVCLGIWQRYTEKNFHRPTGLVDHLWRRGKHFSIVWQLFYLFVLGYHLCNLVFINCEDQRNNRKKKSVQLRKPAGTESEAAREVRVDLQGSDLWKKFYEIGTEMIITKVGR